jgi:hypothetical protein
MQIRAILFAAILVAGIASCNSGERIPDVSAINAETVVRRFDQDFFMLDTANVSTGLDALQQRYPQFLPDYLVKVLGIKPADPRAEEAIKAFMRSYRAVYEAGNAQGKALQQAEKDIRLALQLMQHYIPTFKPEKPFEIITFVGPMDAYESFATGDYGDVRTRTGVGVAMQFHLGAGAPVYEQGRSAGVLYDYQIRRFEPGTIPVNAVKNIIDDVFPYMASGKPLVEEMIEKGKRLYLLDKLLPNTHDSLKLGYTGSQLKGCMENEALIWNFFVKNDLLYSIEPTVNQQYIKDGPKTQELGEGAPGYIGLFVGRQLVRAYMKKHPEISMPQMMQTPATTILNGAGYKP